MARLNYYLCVLILLILITQSVSGAINVKNMVVSPSGDLVSGKIPPGKVAVSFVVNFVPDGGMTFSSSNSLDMFTDLENARWSYSTVLDGNINPPLTDSGNSVDINGWVLSYPSRRDLSILVNMTGEVPTVSATGKKTVVKVGVYNGGNEVYPGTAVIREANVILPGSPAVPSGTTTPATQLSSGQTPVVTATTRASTTATPSTSAPSSSMLIPVGIITIIFLLMSFIPLGLLVFHDYFGLEKLSIPQPFRVRVAIAIVQVLCGIGLLFVLFTLQAIYTDLVVAESGLAPVFVLLVLLLVSYVTLSAFALAIGSLLSKAFRWTLKTHGITGIAVLILAPVTIITLGTNPEILQSRTVVVIVAIIAALITALLALWQDHTLRDDLGSDWFSLLSDFFQRVKGDLKPKKTSQADTGAAITILNTRLAKGEISLEEYNQLKEAIKK
ncbi:MAG: SHOCT domain-containing protein [Methanomicrobiales archaeon]